MELYLHSSNKPSWCGAQLQKKESTGTTLPFTSEVQWPSKSWTVGYNSCEVQKGPLRFCLGQSPHPFHGVAESSGRELGGCKLYSCPWTIQSKSEGNAPAFTCSKEIKENTKFAKCLLPFGSECLILPSPAYKSKR
jgi:hypothetical protein